MYKEIVLVRILKLVIWDLDETILTGILEEGDDEINSVASKVMQQLDERGILQALATQNPPDVIPLAIERFGWSSLFVQVEADLGSKARKIRRILDTLGISPLDAVFVDEDPFERGSISAQISDITAWSIAGLEAYLDSTTAVATEEARRRPRMYHEQQVRTRDGEATSDYTEFLHACNIHIIIRPYVSEDALRAEELLTRTHRMNLGVLPVDEAIARLNRPDEHHVIVAEMDDIYGDMGRCGIIHLSPDENSGAMMESLAISCRTRARGLSLAMLVGLLRHTKARFQTYRCRYIFNGSNRPLRMLLMAAGFKPQPGTDELVLDADRLATMELPDWVHINYQLACEEK
jgi:methoxymalonate biosynthesis protein